MMITCALVLTVFADASAQMYRRENRRGIRDFENGDYDGAVGHFEKSLGKDTVNVVPLMYNMAYVLHSDRRDSTQNAVKDSLAMDYLARLEKIVEGTEYEYDYHFTKGSIAIDMEDWQGAVDEFKKCLIMDPEDMMARENYVYAKEHLKNQQNSSGGGGQNQDQNQEQDQNQDQQNEDQQQGDQDQQQNEDQQQGDQGQQQDEDQQQGDQDQQQGEGQPQESKISPQAAKQILQAMQAKEKETQDKVEKKKAAAMKSKQKQKNW